MENLEKKYYKCLVDGYAVYKKGSINEEDDYLIHCINKYPNDWELVETEQKKPYWEHFQIKTKCENCKFLIELYKHPQNKIFNGSVTEKANLYACIVRLDKESENTGFIFENNQGICELHKKRFD